MPSGRPGDEVVFTPLGLQGHSVPMDLGGGPIEGDAFGQALLARQEGRSGDIISERDDGLVERDSFDYFSAPHGPLWEWVVARVGHRILDIGAGAGREALALQAMGWEVLALDVSPGAIEVCRRRGVVSTFLGTVQDLAVTGPGLSTAFSPSTASAWCSTPPTQSVSLTP